MLEKNDFFLDFFFALQTEMKEMRELNRNEQKRKKRQNIQLEQKSLQFQNQPSTSIDMEHFTSDLQTQNQLPVPQSAEEKRLKFQSNQQNFSKDTNASGEVIKTFCFILSKLLKLPLFCVQFC